MSDVSTMTGYKVLRGEREFLYTEDGSRWIDVCSGVYGVSYGYSHPRIASVFQKWSEKRGLISCCDAPCEVRNKVHDELSLQLGFDEVRLFSTDAEAVEKALMMALDKFGWDCQVVAFYGGFHCETFGTRGF